MAVNLMGFKKTDCVKKNPIRKNSSIYLPLLREVASNGGIYMLDTKDDKRAISLTTTLRRVIKQFDIKDVIVSKQYTIVYVINDNEE
jgi:hypothetical protein